MALTDGLRKRRNSVRRNELHTGERPSANRGSKRWLTTGLCFCGLQVLIMLASDLYRQNRCKELMVTKEFANVTSKKGDPAAHRNAASFRNNEPELTTDIMVTIYSYDRPRSLLRLLKDITREEAKARKKVMVHVLDDNSFGCTFPSVTSNIFDDFDWKREANLSASRSATLELAEVKNGRSPRFCPGYSRFSSVLEYMSKRGWRMFVAKNRHARRRYWHLVHMANALLRNVRAGHYFFLPDDDRLAQGFFSRVVEIWDAAERDPKLMTLMLHHEETRARVPVWTDLHPRRVSQDLHRIGWVESGNFMCSRNLLELLQWSFPRVPPKRWVDNPPISSGVGAVLSQLLYDKKYSMYRTEESFVAHMGVHDSKMNSAFRNRNFPSLLTRNFADGDEAYQSLLEDSYSVTASIASKWTRVMALQAAVDSLAPQVDHVNVYLNDYESVPPFLYAPYITVVLSRDREEGDIGDVGKFYWTNELTTTFHLTADDDIIYPPDYVERMVSFLLLYRGPVAVGVHGIKLKPGVSRGYYGSREVFMGTEQVKKEVGVHILGTGTMLYRVSDVGSMDVKEVFREPNMADVWFGIYAKKLKLPLVVIPHEEGWLREIPGTFEDSLYKKFTKRRRADHAQTRAVRLAAPWTIQKAVKRGVEERE